MKSTKQNFILFLGMSLMLAFTYFNYNLLRDIKDILIVTKVGAKMIPMLKMWTVPATLIAGLILILISWGGKIGRAFYAYIPVNIAILSAFAWILQGNSPLSSNPYIIGGFYVWAKISMVLSLVLVIGFANQEYTFKTAALQYPILILLFSNLSSWGAGKFALSMSNHIQQDSYYMLIGAVVVLNFLTLAVYLWMNRCNLGVKEKGYNVSAGYWIALAAVVFFAKFSTFSSELVFKGDVNRVFSDPWDFSHFIQNHLNLVAMAGIIAGTMSVGIGVFLYFTGSRTLMIIMAMIAMGALFADCIFFYTSQSIGLNEENIWTGTMGYTLMVSLMGIFTLFKELAYFGVERRKRFTAKLAIDVLVLTVAPMAASFITTTAMVFAPMNELTSLFAAIFFVAVIACMAGLYRMHQDLRTGLPGPEKMKIPQAS